MFKNLFWKFFESFIDPHENKAIWAAYNSQIFMLVSFLLLAIILKFLGVSSFLSHHRIVFGLTAILLGSLSAIAASNLKNNNIPPPVLKTCIAIIALTFLFLLTVQRFTMLGTLTMFVIFGNFILAFAIDFDSNGKIIIGLLAVLIVCYILYWIFAGWEFWNIFNFINFFLLITILLIQLRTIINMKIIDSVVYDFTEKELQSLPYNERITIEAFKKEPLKAGAIYGFIHFFFIAETLSILSDGVTDGTSSDSKN